MDSGLDGTSDLVDAHIENILEKMWQHGVSHHEALLVMKFVVELEEVPEVGKTLHKNFIVVFFHLMTYAVYCTKKKMVATTLTEKLVGTNGKRNFYKNMKKFYDTVTAGADDLKGHYESILIGMYINAVAKNEHAVYKVPKKDVMNKRLKSVIDNLKTDFSQKERRGTWNDLVDFNYKLMYAKHVEILSWAGLSE